MLGPDWLYHPLGVCAQNPHAQYVACRGYNFWSGIGSDFGEITLLATAIAALLVVWRFYINHLTCHVTTCKKPALHHVPGTAFRTCLTHHPEIPNGEITVEHIHAAHRNRTSRRPSVPTEDIGATTSDTNGW